MRNHHHAFPFRVIEELLVLRKCTKSPKAEEAEREERGRQRGVAKSGGKRGCRVRHQL